MPRGVIAEDGSTPWHQGGARPPLPADCLCRMEPDRQTIYKHGCPPHRERGHTYNERAALSNRVLERQVEHANAIEAANGTDEVRAALAALLEEFGNSMSDADQEHVLDALTGPVAFANRKAGERGRFHGRRETQKRVAHELGLGDLATEDFRG